MRLGGLSGLLLPGPPGARQSPKAWLSPSRSTLASLQASGARVVGAWLMSRELPLLRADPRPHRSPGAIVGVGVWGIVAVMQTKRLDGIQQHDGAGGGIVAVMALLAAWVTFSSGPCIGTKVGAYFPFGPPVRVHGVGESRRVAPTIALLRVRKPTQRPPSSM